MKEKKLKNIKTLAMIWTSNIPFFYPFQQISISILNQTVPQRDNQYRFGCC